MQRFNLTVPADSEWRRQRIPRYAMLALIGFFLVVLGQTLAELAVHAPQALSAENRQPFLLDLYGAAVLVALICIIGWVGGPTFKRFPVTLELDQTAARFVYPSGRVLAVDWVGPPSAIYLHDLRNRSRYRNVKWDFETWVETKYLRVVAPLTAPAFDALISAASAAGATVEPVDPPRITALWNYVGPLGRMIRVTVAGVRA